MINNNTFQIFHSIYVEQILPCKEELFQSFNPERYLLRVLTRLLSRGTKKPQFFWRIYFVECMCTQIATLTDELSFSDYFSVDRKNPVCKVR